MYTPLKVNTGTRIGSMLLDHFIMSAAAMVLTIPAVFMNLFSNVLNTTHAQESGIKGPTFYIALIGFACYFCKDVFQGRSPGKRITKLQIVDYKTGEQARPVRTVIRNLFCIIWPVEVIITLINPGRRLGDLVAGTKVVNYDPVQHPRSRVKVAPLMLSLLLAYGFILAIALPFRDFFNNFGQAPYIEQSYNEQESKVLQALFTDSMGTRMNTSVRIYDKTEGSNLKYIHIIHTLKQNEVENDNQMEQLRAITHSLLNTVYPDATYTGQEIFVYKDGYSMRSVAQTIGNKNN